MADNGAGAATQGEVPGRGGEGVHADDAVPRSGGTWGGTHRDRGSLAARTTGAPEVAHSVGELLRQTRVLSISGHRGH